MERMHTCAHVQRPQRKAAKAIERPWENLGLVLPHSIAFNHESIPVTIAFIREFEIRGQLNERNQINGVKSTPFVSSHGTIYIFQALPQPFFPPLIFHGHHRCQLKTVFTDCRRVCSKGCLLMSEPMKRGASGEGDKVRAVSHAPQP